MIIFGMYFYHSVNLERLNDISGFGQWFSDQGIVSGSVSRLEDSISSIDTRYIMVDGRNSQCSRA